MRNCDDASVRVWLKMIAALIAIPCVRAFVCYSKNEASIGPTTMLIVSHTLSHIPKILIGYKMKHF